MALPLRTSTLIGILALTLWGCLLSVGVVIYVRYSSPTQLAAVVNQKLTAETGMAWHVDRATVKIFPRPHVQLESVSLRHPGLQLDVPGITAYMSWPGLLSLRFIPGHIALDSPVLSCNLANAETASDPLSLSQAVPAQAAPQGLTERLPAILPESLQDMRLTIHHGTFESNGSSIRTVVNDLNASIRLPGFFAGSLDLDVEELSVFKHERNLSTLSAFRLRAQNISVPEESQTFLRFETGDMEAILTLPAISERLNLRLHLAMQDNPLSLTGLLEAQGNLASSPPTPLRLHLPFALNQQKMQLQDVRLELDNDAASLQATMTLGDWHSLLAPATHTPAEAATRNAAQQKPTPPSMKGTATIHHLSLPRWFEFARLLPAGLEQTLNDLAGELDFTLTPQRLDVPRLRAEVRGMHFTGTGGVSDFSKPNIRIAVNAKAINANTLFPELVQRTSKAIVWPGPPPVRQDTFQEGPDYDIQLAAAEAEAWKFAMAQLTFRCTPLSKGSRLAIEAKSFYDGALAATVDIEDQIAVTAALTHVTMENPAALVAGYPMLGGHVTGKAVLIGSDASFDHFLASLNGNVQGQITKGWLASPGSDTKQAFDAMDFAFKAAGPGLAQPPMPSLLPYTGEWKIGLRTLGWEGIGTLNGALALDSSTFALRHAHDVPGRLQWNENGLAVNLDARFDFDHGKETLHIRNASGRMSGGRLSGSLTGSNLFASSSPAAPQWQGTLNLTTTAVRSILKQRGLLPTNMPEEALQYMQLRGDFSLDGQKLQARNLSGKVDDTTFSGSIVYALDEAYTWQANLALGTLNLNRYIPKSQPGSVQAAAPWSTRLLDGISAKGVINLNNLILARLVQRSVRLPFVLEKNALTCNPITFVPYNGKGEGDLRVEASTAGYRTRLRYAANKADAALFSREANFSTVLGGTAALNADMAGLLQQSSDFPSALDGNWSVNVTQGYLADKKPDGLLGKPTPFHSIGASGIMKHGILHTQDISLKGNELAANGNASINLIDWTLNCNLNVSTKNFSNVPVAYSGSLDAPERSVNALNAVAGAIGKLGSGLYGLLEDVFSSPLRLLK